MPRELEAIFGGRVGLIRNTTSDRLLIEADVVVAVGYVSALGLDCRQTGGKEIERVCPSRRARPPFGAAGAGFLKHHLSNNRPSGRLDVCMRITD